MCVCNQGQVIDFKRDLNKKNQLISIQWRCSLGYFLHRSVFWITTETVTSFSLLCFSLILTKRKAWLASTGAGFNSSSSGQLCVPRVNTPHVQWHVGHFNQSNSRVRASTTEILSVSSANWKSRKDGVCGDRRCYGVCVLKGGVQSPHKCRDLTCLHEWMVLSCGVRVIIALGGATVSKLGVFLNA